jgi:hypothetical protein
VLPWLRLNPNGPDDEEEQEENLLREVESAESPEQAAAYILNAIWSRQVA